MTGGEGEGEGEEGGGGEEILAGGRAHQPKVVQEVLADLKKIHPFPQLQLEEENIISLSL